MRFLKIKFKDGKVFIEYEVKRQDDKDPDQFSFSSADSPQPSFPAALQALAEDVVEMCELAETDTVKIEVKGVSFSYGGADEIMGATIVAQKRLRYSNTALNLNTPHKASEPYSEGGDESLCLTDDCTKRLTRLMDEAKQYIEGVRAQMDLFALKEAVDEHLDGPEQVRVH
ncbi:hypothetical protein ANRL1_02181 [Anaerolineae bacterium]|nr:hypothetical protein ANRL1_02181 [Anaerolineae bacterium]